MSERQEMESEKTKERTKERFRVKVLKQLTFLSRVMETRLKVGGGLYTREEARDATIKTEEMVNVGEKRESCHFMERRQGQETLLTLQHLYTG